jgi:hypothetical protein
MTAVHLFDHHAGKHRAKAAEPKRGPSLRRRIAVQSRGLLAALMIALEPWSNWWEWPPVQAHYRRQYRRADRKAFAAEMEAARAMAPFGVTAWPAEDNPPRDETDGWAQTAALAGEHPYPPLPVTLPLASGDGHVHIDENGHVTVRRGAPVPHPTLYDLPMVRPYALAMGPTGCEET